MPRNQAAVISGKSRPMARCDRSLDEAAQAGCVRRAIGGEGGIGDIIEQAWLLAPILIVRRNIALWRRRSATAASGSSKAPSRARSPACQPPATWRAPQPRRCASRAGACGRRVAMPRHVAACGTDRPPARPRDAHSGKDEGGEEERRQTFILAAYCAVSRRHARLAPVWPKLRRGTEQRRQRPALRDDC